MSVPKDQRVVLIVAAADRDAANRDAEAAVPGAGSMTFAVGLSPAGATAGTAPSHYICSWLTTPEQREILRGRFDRADRGRGYLTYSDADPSGRSRVENLLRSRSLVFHAHVNSVGRSFSGGER